MKTFVADAVNSNLNLDSRMLVELHDPLQCKHDKCYRDRDILMSFVYCEMKIFFAELWAQCHHHHKNIYKNRMQPFQHAAKKCHIKFLIVFLLIMKWKMVKITCIR